MELKILIADDHPIFRKGVNSFLNNDFPKSTITETADGDDALSLLSTHEFDVAILDVDMPKMTSLDVCKTIQKAKIPTHVIIMTIYKDAEILRKALENGALGFLIKENTAEELKQCIETVISGEKYIARELRTSEKINEQLKEHNKTIEKLESLTNTELKTLRLVSEKHSSKEIADLLFISPKSTENYRNRICRKLDLSTTSNSLLIWAVENKGIIKEFEKLNLLRSVSS